MTKHAAIFFSGLLLGAAVSYILQPEGIPFNQYPVTVGDTEDFVDSINNCLDDSNEACVERELEYYRQTAK
jgi:hypothetical protein